MSDSPAIIRVMVQVRGQVRVRVRVVRSSFVTSSSDLPLLALTLSSPPARAAMIYNRVGLRLGLGLRLEGGEWTQL